MPVELFPIDSDRMLCPGADIYVGRFLREYGQYSPGEHRLFKQILRPTDIAIDVGANIGIHTIAMARLASHVYAFEPQRLLFNCLCGNLALNNIKNVSPWPLAVGENPGSIVVPDLDADLALNFGGVRLNSPKANWSGYQVAVTTLDMVADQFASLRLIKADVEGMEVEVLKGGCELIKRTRPFLYVEDDRQDRSNELYALLKTYEYKLFEHRPRYIEAEGVPDDLKNLVSCNLLAVPAESKVKINSP